MQVLYDRSYAVYKIATSLVEPLLIGGYSSQELRDILVGLVEDAITKQRPTVRFENGKAIQLEEYYLQHGSQPETREEWSAVERGGGVGDDPLRRGVDNFEPYVAAGEVMTPSDVAAGLVDSHYGEFELLPTEADMLAAESAPIDINENLVETPEVAASTEFSAKATPKATPTSRKGTRK